MSDGKAARAYIGLALLGWGLSILLQVAPHEDPLVGAGLLVFGTALFFTAPRRPSIASIPGFPLIAVGAAAIFAILGYGELTGAHLSTTKFAIVAYGLFLLVIGTALRHPTLRRSTRRHLSSTAACSLPVVAMPLIVWTFQAAFTSALGTTPIEQFVHFGLLLPMAAALSIVGWDPVIDGQMITYSTLNGPLTLNVGAACSGVQAMAMFGGVLAMFVLLERPAGRSLAVWSAIGIFGVYLANLLRIAVLLAVGYRWGSDALLQVHAQAGWIFFVAWALPFAALVKSRATTPISLPRNPLRSEIANAFKE